MALIRLAYAANLPTPDDLVKKLQGAPLKRQQPEQSDLKHKDHNPEHQSAANLPPQQAAKFDPIPGSSGQIPMCGPFMPSKRSNPNPSKL